MRSDLEDYIHPKNSGCLKLCELTKSKHVSSLYIIELSALEHVPCSCLGTPPYT